MSAERSMAASPEVLGGPVEQGVGLLTVLGGGLAGAQMQRSLLQQGLKQWSVSV